MDDNSIIINSLYGDIRSDIAKIKLLYGKNVDKRLGVSYNSLSDLTVNSYTNGNFKKIEISRSDIARLLDYSRIRNEESCIFTVCSDDDTIWFFKIEDNQLVFALRSDVLEYKIDSNKFLHIGNIVIDLSSFTSDTCKSKILLEDLEKEKDW